MTRRAPPFIFATGYARRSAEDGEVEFGRLGEPDRLTDFAGLGGDAVAGSSSMSPPSSGS